MTLGLAQLEQALGLRSSMSLRTLYICLGWGMCLLVSLSKAIGEKKASLHLELTLYRARRTAISSEEDNGRTDTDRHVRSKGE